MLETSPRVLSIHSEDVAAASQLKVRTKVPTCSQDNMLQLSPGRHQSQVADTAPSRLPSGSQSGQSKQPATQSEEAESNQGHQKYTCRLKMGQQSLWLPVTLAA